MLSPDRVVLHALFGFWHPEDLARELRFAKVLARLWSDQSRTRAEKDAMYERLQLAELRRQPPETFARSGWQNFDRKAELRELRAGARDTFFLDTVAEIEGVQLGPVLKPLNVIVHERMAARPFIAFEDFDVESFVDYGRDFYDNNMRAGKRGKVFRAARFRNEKRQAAERRAAKLAAKKAQKAERSKKRRRRS